MACCIIMDDSNKLPSYIVALVCGDVSGLLEVMLELRKTFL